MQVHCDLRVVGAFGDVDRVEDTWLVNMLVRASVLAGTKKHTLGLRF